MLQDVGLAQVSTRTKTATPSQSVRQDSASLLHIGIERDSRASIKHPELLLGGLRQRIDSTPETPLGLIQTLHMDTLLSAAGSAPVVADGKVNSEIIRFARQIRNKGVTALYPIGAFESTAYSELMLAYFSKTWEQPAPGAVDWRPWVGASVFSIDNYAPNLLIGSRENLSIFVKALKDKAGLAIAPCLVTNTLGIGGFLARTGLGHVADYPRHCRPPGELEHFQGISANPETFGAHKIWQKGLIRGPGSSSPGEHCLQIIEFPVPNRPDWRHRLFHYDFRGTDGHRHAVYTVFDPVAGFKPFCWISDQLPGAGKPEIFLKKLGSQSPSNPFVEPKDVWGDTLQLKVSGVSRQEVLQTTHWFAKRYAEAVSGIFEFARADMAHLPDEQFWRSFQESLADASGPNHAPRFIAEAYCGAHGRLVQAGLSPYAKYVLEWLAARETSAIHAYLFSLGGAEFLRECVGFTANHDDKASGSLPKQVADFAAVVTMPFGKILAAQGQLDGISNFRFSADMHVPHHPFKEFCLKVRGTKREFISSMRRLARLAELPVFRDPNSATSPAFFEKHQDPASNEVSGVLHFSRQYTAWSGRTDKVATVVDYTPNSRSGEPLVLKVRETFGISPADDLERFSLVDLLNGRVYPAAERHELALGHNGPAFDAEVYLLALVPRHSADAQLLH